MPEGARDTIIRTSATGSPGEPRRAEKPRARWRVLLHQIIFEADTPAGKAFDIILIGSILSSVAAVMADSVATISERLGATLSLVEWVLTLLFSLEYVLRLLAVDRPGAYARSFFSISS